MPISQALLSDLVSDDLVSIFVTSATSIYLCLVPIELQISVQTVLAHALQLILNFAFCCLFIYLNVNITVQFLQMHYKVVSLTDRLTDAEVQCMIRLFVIALGLLLHSLILYLDQNNSMIFYLLAGKFGNQEISVMPLTTNVIIGTIALMTNTAFKIVIFCERKKSDEVLGYSNHVSDMPLTLFQWFAFVLAVTFVPIIVLYTSLNEQRAVGLWHNPAMFAYLCIIIPVAYCVHHRKLRHFALSKLSNHFESVVYYMKLRRRQKVSPFIP